MQIKWLAVLCLLFSGAGWLQAQAEAPEIVIEMHGEPSPVRESVSIWDKNARQLTKLFRGKNRTYVLYHVENVSSKDTTLSAQDGTEYVFVQYGSNDTDYRKFLFKAEDPQTFVACAADIKDVLAVNKKYKVNLGVSLRDFLRQYEEKATLMNLADNAAGKVYQVYQLNYSDINHKTPSPHYFVFEEDALLQTYDSDDAYYQFVGQISNNNKQLTAQQQAQQQARQEKLQQARQEALRRQNQPVRKALVSGGTAYDQAYMPRAVNATPLPALTPSKLPAGTPLPTPQ